MRIPELYDSSYQALFGSPQKIIKLDLTNEKQLSRPENMIQNDVEHGSSFIEKDSFSCESLIVNSTEVLSHENPSKASLGGCVWDIFRRQDIPKLTEYLRRHWKEFRHFDQSPIDSVIHPIHDQTLFLDKRHKQQLKKEYNVEPWSFEQHLGEAVFIPAGCPHQVRNRQSCIKVALDFVSPENLWECVRLTEEFRLLPKIHRAKEDKLEVKKMAVYAMVAAIKELKDLNSNTR
ncbi:hypothetical protein HPP92_024174 [Vanilla planifolia]|uniref:JmjC domain-containing protein n=1 Tax=Vanilla planifolia TaxID=51239 RepID=A0A835UAW9_VANPL|nr:hypothetical protein HPP92_024174 [Vanilla planifolia]